MSEKVAKIQEECTACEVCIEECPTQAIEAEEIYEADSTGITRA